MTDWQALISEAAVQCFLRSGKVPTFLLARGDMVDLCAQVMQRDPEDLRRDISGEGFVAIRCAVHSEPLSRAVIVDEWTQAG
jgi:hypothetical protein